MVLVAAAGVKELSLVGSQTTQVAVVGVSIEAVALLKEGSARVVQLSLLPVKVFPFQVMAFQAQALLLFLPWIVVVAADQLVVIVGVELGQ